MNSINIEKETLTQVVRMVFADQTNHHGTMFGGEALSMMTSAASHAAARRAGAAVVMASTERTDFRVPVHQGAIVQVDAFVSRVGRTSLIVDVILDVEDLLTGRRNRATVGRFTFVAVDQNGKPTPVRGKPPQMVGLPPTWTVERVQPGQVNHQGRLRGGELMRLLDAIAFICATRKARAPIVTARVDKLDIGGAAKVGDLLYLGAKVIDVGDRSLTVKTDVWVDRANQTAATPVTSGHFVMVRVPAA